VERQRVARLWVYGGLYDLFFAFETDDIAFEDHAVFHEIMGMEKFLKAVLLFGRHAEYEALKPVEAKYKLNDLAKALGHNFKRMIEEMNQLVPVEVERLRKGNWNSFGGAALIDALTDGYMETRYPVPKSASERFPIGKTGFLHDPFGSSGPKEFIYAVCNMCYAYLAPLVDFRDMKADFEKRFQHRSQSLQRFYNLFWEPRCISK
jgi:hypothetical protein